MRTLGAAMVSAIGILLSLYCCTASATCDLSSFDSGPPAAVKDNVDNQFAKFEWASDVDSISGRLRVWHYILNKGDRGLGVVWEKAAIRIPKVRPLAPGVAFCNRFWADSVRQDPDTDAPIIYGTNDQVQQAAVYVAEKPPKMGETNSSINTSYADENGKEVSVDVQLRSIPTSKGFYLELFHSPDVVVGVSGLPQTLSPSQFELVADSVKAQHASVNRATYFEYTKKDPAEALGGLYWREKAPSEKADFLFFSGFGKIGFEIPANSTRKITADMVVLDKNLQPIFATDVMLLAPVRE